MRIATVAGLGCWVALASIAGCGDGGGSGGANGGAYSCRAAFPGADGGAGMVAVCLEASGGTAQDLTNNRQQCTAEGNMFVSEPCPRTGALGGCRETTTLSNAVLTTWYYQDGNSTAADIQSLCEGLAGVAPAQVMITFVTP